MNAKKNLKNPLDIGHLIDSWPFKLPNIKKITQIDKSKFKNLHPRIALIDTGINTSHPCFLNSTIISKDFSGGSNPIDEIGHGTHCGAILVANSFGMKGLYPRATLYSAKIIGKHKRSKVHTEKAFAQAIKWVIKENIQMIVITLGRYTSSSIIKKYINYALNKGVIVISSAGNHAGSLPLFPASVPGVLCISALSRNGLPLPECYQGGLVDVFAPGEAIPSARLRGFGKMTGSSQAAAVFCGLIARQLY